MTAPPIPTADTALARLFTGESADPNVSWFSLPGGQVLCEAGETADQLFFLRTGRLGVFRRGAGEESIFLGVIRPGEPAGEMAMIAGTVHSSTVVALRDSEVLALPRDVFFDLASRDSAVMLELARLMILRARQTAANSSVGEPSVFGFIGLTADVAVRDLVEQIGQEIRRLGYSVTTVGDETISAPTEWFSNVEQSHDFVLYVAEAAQTQWKHIVGRQVDRLFRIGRGDLEPTHGADLHASGPLQTRELVDLILLHPTGRAPTRSEAWVDAVSPARLFHIRQHEHGDVGRMARAITGQSVGLVLSGGGARAYAHVGAVRALRATGAPIDFVGGVSMGAIIAAAVAMGWDDEEIDWRIRKAFVETSPVSDAAVPLIAMTQGLLVGARLREHFGEKQISDLWLPFFCISSNLTSGAYQVHRRGLLRAALRASIAIPGLLPPVTQDDNVLVDGAVMKNFPTDVMRAMHLGPIVGVDVTRGRNITADDVARPSSVWRWILSGDWRKGPPIVSLLMRAATVSTSTDWLANREASDVLVAPRMDGVEIRDWRAYEPAVEAGQVAMTEALSKLSKPVTELRRRRSLEDPPANPDIIGGR
ncbi:MAG TPA: patatin-like phospholipase family protein, partial [Caulobacteraceae bacterium]|nr:patatin-like phospholipase family protein [Caulobacteraceae bacterium]